MSLAFLMLAVLGCNFSSDTIATSSEGDLMGLLGADDPCRKYVDYMCACHTEGGFDCEGARRTYEKANRDVQDECIRELEWQKGEDVTAGVECSAKEPQPG